MKVIAGFLAAYILLLSAIPCSDTLPFSYENPDIISSIKAHEDSHNHDTDGDFCSPFCFCDCCQVKTEISTNFPTGIFSFNSKNNHPVFCFHIKKDFVSDFWNPPEV